MQFTQHYATLSSVQEIYFASVSNMTMRLLVLGIYQAQKLIVHKIASQHGFCTSMPLASAQKLSQLPSSMVQMCVRRKNSQKLQRRYTHILELERGDPLCADNVCDIKSHTLVDSVHAYSELHANIYPTL